jgi:hypothetical protein
MELTRRVSIIYFLRFAFAFCQALCIAFCPGALRAFCSRDPSRARRKLDVVKVDRLFLQAGRTISSALWLVPHEGRIRPICACDPSLLHSLRLPSLSTWGCGVHATTCALMSASVSNRCARSAVALIGAGRSGNGSVDGSIGGDWAAWAQRRLLTRCTMWARLAGKYLWRPAGAWDLRAFCHYRCVAR